MDARSDILGLLSAARRGVPEAIGQIFESARLQLYHLANRELPDDVRAKIGPSDIVQETAIDAQRDFARFVGTTPEELFAWLREVLRHNVIDAVRHYRGTAKREAAREVRLGSTDGQRAVAVLQQLTRSPPGSAILREEAATLNQVLARLPADYRRVLQLRYWHGLSFIDMAPLLDRSPDAARKLWYRALARLSHDLVAMHAADAAAVRSSPARD